jgi:hypothetical protein
VRLANRPIGRWSLRSGEWRVVQRAVLLPALCLAMGFAWWQRDASAASLSTCGSSEVDHARGAPVANCGLSVVDLIGLSRIGSTMFGGFGGDDGVLSPDGTHEAIVIQKGRLQDNSREFSLFVFSTADTKRAEEPVPIAQFVSRTNRPGISSVVWLSDDFLGFVGEGATHAQVYTASLRTRQISQRTSANLPVTVFKSVAAGRFILYATESSPKKTSGFETLHGHGFVIPRSMPIVDLMAGKWEQVSSGRPQPSVLHLVRDGVESTVRLPDEVTYGACRLDYSGGEDDVTLAPSGDIAMVRCRPSHSPTGWRAYQEKEFREGDDEGAQYPWWIVLDLQTGATWPLTGAASMNFDTTPLWTADSCAVIVVNDLLPVNGSEGVERDERANHRLTGEVDVRTGATLVVARDQKLAFREWDVGTSTLTLEQKREGDPPRSVLRLRKTASGWSELQATKATDTKPRLQVREGLNEPWKLITVKAGRTKSVLVYDPNPQLLKKHRLATETIFKWTTRSGEQLSAGLYLPLDYQKGRRYPVVIQTHGFESGKFAPDGYSTTGYAAQPLAAAGIMVIQAFDPRRIEKGESIQQGFESLIDQLDAEGLIDRNKVGLQGYSGSCFDQLYFMTHSSYPIAGMTCTDGVDDSYLQYLIGVPFNPRLAKQFEDANGGAPFGATLKMWMERAPGFNLDHIHSPVRLTAMTDPLSLLAEWEPFAGLVLQNKPAELFYLPDAAHNIVRPWERVASQQGTVDWFRFWLQDYERTEPIGDVEETSQQLTDQYARWHGLSELQQSDLAKLRVRRAPTG